VKFKLDENLSPLLAMPFTAAGYDAHSVVQQSLGGQPDDRVIEVCRVWNDVQSDAVATLTGTIHYKAVKAKRIAP
jgi:hypothetical protein